MSRRGSRGDDRRRLGPDRRAAARPSAARRSGARPLRDSYALFGVSTVLIALYASGFGGPALYAAIIVLGIGGGVIGTRRHQERMTWPWWCLAAAATLWIGSGVIALMTASTGDLSSGRSVLADLFAVPGYVFFGASLHGLARARGVSHDRDTVLDGIMVAAASALLIWETLIQRTLDDEGTWVVAKVLVTSYPILSMCLLVLAARLAFASGPRTTAFNLLLAGTACFLIGDVLFAFGEIGLITLPETVLDIPYLLVPTCFGAALLHPSSSRVGTPVSAHHRRSGRGRLIVVALALLAPLPLMVEHRAGGVPVAPLVIVAILSITGVVRISTAIGDQLRLTRALYHRATHDELTGLVSRSVLLEQADEWLAGGRQVAVLFLDLDRFKYVNDSMGHTAGDELLVGVASRLVGVCPTDAIVSRQSGDEFAVAVPDTGVADAFHLAEQIRRTVRVGHRLAAARRSWRRRSASPCRGRGRPRRRPCSRKPTPRCIAPRRPGATPRRCSTRRCRPGSITASTWSERCTRPSRTTSSPSSTSRSTTCAPAGRSAPRRSPGGTASPDRSRRPTSSPWPRTRG
jgi:diguanylate cyclase